MIVLRSDHYIDTPADIIVLETSTGLINRSDTVNSGVKLTYPGYYTSGKAKKANLKQGSVLVMESDGIVPFRDNRPVVVAGCCVYSPALMNPSIKNYLYTLDKLFAGFWKQDRFQTIGMNLIGARSKRGMNMNSLIQEHIICWDRHRNDKPDRILYLHSVESSFLAPIKSPVWEGPFKKVAIWNPLFPQLEN